MQGRFCSPVWIHEDVRWGRAFQSFSTYACLRKLTAAGLQWVGSCFLGCDLLHRFSQTLYYQNCFFLHFYLFNKCGKHFVSVTDTREEHLKDRKNLSWLTFKRSCNGPVSLFPGLGWGRSTSQWRRGGEILNLGGDRKQRERKAPGSQLSFKSSPC